VSDAAEGTTLLSEMCIACHPDAPPATAAEIAELSPLIPDWTQEDHNGVPRLVRTFRVPTFRDALLLTQRVGELAEREGHHPLLVTRWGRVTVSWWTQKIRNLHRNDFIMAAKTDALARELGVIDGEMKPANP
jgi:4a-hydroxytetrahydrobiopterin dehydratase